MDKSAPEKAPSKVEAQYADWLSGKSKDAGKGVDNYGALSTLFQNAASGVNYVSATSGSQVYDVKSLVGR